MGGVVMGLHFDVPFVYVVSFSIFFPFLLCVVSALCATGVLYQKLVLECKWVYNRLWL